MTWVYLPGPPAIACYEGGCDADGGQYPLEIFSAKVRWARPELFLICGNVFEKWRNQSVLGVLSWLKPDSGVVVSNRTAFRDRQVRGSSLLSFTGDLSGPRRVCLRLAVKGHSA